MNTAIAALAASWLLLPAAQPAMSETPQTPVRVLVVTGVDPAHNWRASTPALRAALEQGGRIEARVIEDPEFLASPALFQYDVVLLHFMNDKPLRHAQQVHDNLARFVREGKGLVVFHFACGAFEGWEEFANLAGRIWDRKRTHDPRGRFTVKIVDRQHPITRGLQDFEADDELYFCLVGDRPVQLLAVARSKVTNQDEPMALAFHYGKGRVFNTPLGHDAKAIAMPGVAELIRRGCLWAAGREP